MNEDWLHKVHDRMTDYEIEEPENLWDAIESKQASSATMPRPIKKHLTSVLVKRCLSAAAIIAIVIFTGIYLYNGKQDLSQGQLLSDAKEDRATSFNKKITKNKPLIAENAIPEPLSGNSVANKHNSVNTTDIATNNPTDETKGISDISEVKPTDFSEKETDENQNISNRPNKPSEETTPTLVPPDMTFEHNHYKVALQGESQQSGKVSVSFYSSAGTSSTLNSTTKANPFVAAAGPENSNWEDEPMLGILLFNQGIETETEIKHRLPIRAGVSFTYNLNKRFGIESGVGYANLTSDIKNGSKNHYYAAEQRLHYIGVPLNLKYRMISWQRLDLYASAGVLAEKCISAKLDKEYIIDNRKKSSESEDLSDRPMQWSVNASVGVQCNLIESISIFAEPGVSYYFNDGTDLQTIYKEKPLNFNLNMGIRFTFGE